MQSESSEPSNGAGSVGLVETKRVVLFTSDDPLVLDSGATARPGRGRLRDVRRAERRRVERDPRLPRAHRRRPRGGPPRRSRAQVGWWDNLIGPGKPLDTDRWYVISANLLGGCRGTTGPSSLDPATGRALRAPLPASSPSPTWCSVHRAAARAPRHRAARRRDRRLARRRCRCCSGRSTIPTSSAAGIQVCGSARLSAQNIAFSAVARTSIMADEHFAGGDYYDTGTRPDVGLAVARMLAHLTYVSEQSLEEKFGRRFRDDAGEPGLRDRLRGRELPRPPGELVPRALRRELATST